MRPFSLPLLIVLFAHSLQAESLREQTLRAAKKATAFLTEHVSTRGGYVWEYSADLARRAGEGIVDETTVWVQPPGTPSVGEAYVRLFEATGDAQFLLAAQDVAEALRHGQMRSGGWQASIEFDPKRSRRWAYRSLPPSKKAKDQSSLDDAKTQSALRFLIRLDGAIEMRSPAIHGMTMDGLNALLDKGQFSGGGFPQVWMDSRPEDEDVGLMKASFPESWPREYPGHQEYWLRYTLNDHLALDVMEVLLLADRTYDDPRFMESARRLADSLVAAQLPGQQPAWAQQYSVKMQPIWARKFEPPAITTSESYSTIETLLLIFQATGDEKYLQPIQPALDYLKSCELEDGRVARFYELRTNRPLYFNRDYELTYRDDDLPTHYGFKLSSRVATLRRKLNEAMRSGPVPPILRPKRSRPSPDDVRRVIASADDRGIWVEEGTMRYHKTSGPLIRMATVVKRLHLLADYLAATRQPAGFETDLGNSAR